MPSSGRCLASDLAHRAFGGAIGFGHGIIADRRLVLGDARLADRKWGRAAARAASAISRAVGRRSWARSMADLCLPALRIPQEQVRARSGARPELSRPGADCVGGGSGLTKRRVRGIAFEGLGQVEQAAARTFATGGNRRGRVPASLSAKGCRRTGGHVWSLAGACLPSGARPSKK